MNKCSTELTINGVAYAMPNNIDIAFNSNGKTAWVSMGGIYYEFPDDYDDFVATSKRYTEGPQE